MGDELVTKDAVRMNVADEKGFLRFVRELAFKIEGGIIDSLVTIRRREKIFPMNPLSGVVIHIIIPDNGFQTILENQWNLGKVTKTIMHRAKVIE